MPPCIRSAPLCHPHEQMASSFTTVDVSSPQHTRQIFVHACWTLGDIWNVRPSFSRRATCGGRCVGRTRQRVMHAQRSPPNSSLASRNRSFGMSDGHPDGLSLEQPKSGIDYCADACLLYAGSQATINSLRQEVIYTVKMISTTKLEKRTTLHPSEPKTAAIVSAYAFACARLLPY